MPGLDIVNLINAVLLIGCVALIFLPARFASPGLITARGARIVGIVFGMVIAANLVDRLHTNPWELN